MLKIIYQNKYWIILSTLALLVVHTFVKTGDITEEYGVLASWIVIAAAAVIGYSAAKLGIHFDNKANKS